MHTRMTTVEVLPGKMNELVSIYENVLLPAARQQTGFKGSLLLRDPDADKAMLITWWDTEADMHASEASGYYRKKMEKIAHVLSEKPVLKHYDTHGGGKEAYRGPSE